MKKWIWLCSIYFAAQPLKAQELFAFNEPASNMAKGSIGLRINNFLMKENIGNANEYHLIPEIMIGASKKWMIHAEAFMSNRTQSGLTFEGGSIYGKFRFYSNDEVQRHFRMALFGRLSFNNLNIHQQEINLYGHNSGYEMGLIATQLLHKLALSASFSFLHALDNGNGNKLPPTIGANAVGYSFSAGKLILPKKYTNFKQVNVNAMLEILGQTNFKNADSFLDFAPTVQFIFDSKIRLDLGYRKQLLSRLQRTAPNGFLLRFEYNIFNAF